MESVAVFELELEVPQKYWQPATNGAGSVPVLDNVTVPPLVKGCPETAMLLPLTPVLVKAAVRITGSENESTL